MTSDEIIRMAKDAGFGVAAEVTGNYEIIERFARLIAMECSRLAMTEHRSISPADYDDMEPYEQGCDDTASAISGKIRRIFGVEE